MDKAKAQRFTQFLIKKYGEDGAKKKIQKIQKTGKVDEEDIKDFAASEQKQQLQQTQKALHGAKLNYFKSLKNQCAEDEEVVYFKKGGSVTCGCKKKEQGGEVPAAKQGSTIEKFKKARKAATGTGLQKPPFRHETPDKKEGWDDSGNYIVSKKRIEERKKQLEANKNEEGKADPKKIKQQKTRTEQGGSKLAVMKAPRMRVDHMKKGSAIEKFKAAKCGSKLKKHLLGGSLNRIPFMLEGTPKGGVKTRYDEFSGWDLVPFVGSYRDAVRAYDNPSTRNIINAGVSIAGDALGLGALGSVAKAASKYNKISKALKAKGFFRPTGTGRQWIKVGRKETPINAGKFGAIGTKTKPAVYTKTVPEVDVASPVMWGFSSVPARTIKSSIYE